MGGTQIKSEEPPTAKRRGRGDLPTPTCTSTLRHSPALIRDLATQRAA